jgi:transcriptional regulator GlxA family with amidase domain
MERKCSRAEIFELMRQASERANLSPKEADELAAEAVRAVRAAREYTDEQIEQFELADALDGEALKIARQFDQATGGSFFQDRWPEDKLDQP